MIDPRPARRTPRPVLPVLAGLGAVAAVRLLTLPKSPWEWDEILFVRAVERFDPLGHSPHPPGYPLLVGLGKALHLLVGDPFASLVVLSVLSSLVGYLALVSAFHRFALGRRGSVGSAAGGRLRARPPLTPFQAAVLGTHWSHDSLGGDGAGGLGEAGAVRVAVAGALLFHLSAAMLVYGPLALSDPPALMWLALALAAAARLPDAGAAGAGLAAPAALGTFASAAVGCRPQLAVAVLPMLAAALWTAPARLRPAATALAAFTLVSLLWLLPLVAKVGGIGGLAAYLGKQTGYVLAYDAAAPRAVEPGVPGVAHAAHVAARFLAHPWGPRWTSIPVLALAVAGVVGVAGLGMDARRRALPLAVLCGVDLAFCLLVMNPEDSVRYALPSLLGVAFAAAVGLAALARRLRMPAAGTYGAVALFAAASVAYTGPLLAARTATASPPVQAARWATASLPPRSIFLVDEQLAAHASYFLPRATLAPAGAGLARYAGKRGAPVFLLIDGESRWPGAVTFRWPACDAYGKLTRGHYRVVSLSPLPPGRRYAPVRGVLAYEPSLGEPRWRWLEADAAIRLFPVLPRAARSVELTLGLPAEAPWPANAVAIAVAGSPAATLEVPRGGRRTAVLPLPAGVVEIAFRARESFVPSAADPRRLAVQLLDVVQPDRRDER